MRNLCLDDSSKANLCVDDDDDEVKDSTDARKSQQTVLKAAGNSHQGIRAVLTQRREECEKEGYLVPSIQELFKDVKSGEGGEQKAGMV